MKLLLHLLTSLHGTKLTSPDVRDCQNGRAVWLGRLPPLTRYGHAPFLFRLANTLAGSTPGLIVPIARIFVLGVDVVMGCAYSEFGPKRLKIS